MAERSEQTSFHVASEPHVRIEFFNLTVGEAVGPFDYQGNVVLTCYSGAFRLQAGEEFVQLGEYDQAVTTVGERLLRIECEAEGTLQIIWAPNGAITKQG